MQPDAQLNPLLVTMQSGLPGQTNPALVIEQAAWPPAGAGEGAAGGC
jgi:hypothetical protein